MIEKPIKIIKNVFMQVVRDMNLWLLYMKKIRLKG